MYTDCLLLDQCRYYYDWLPTIQMVPDRFKSKAFQVLARCILDRIGWSDYSSDSRPFRHAAVACVGEVPAAAANDFASREVVQAPPS